MLTAALQPNSGVDRPTLLFLRQKLADADRKLAGFRRDPRQEAGYAALRAMLDPARDAGARAIAPPARRGVSCQCGLIVSVPARFSSRIGFGEVSSRSLWGGRVPGPRPEHE